MNNRYRKKPVIIEAVHLAALNTDATIAIPTWFMLAVASGIIKQSTTGEAIVTTLEGDMLAGNTDWIIKGVQGELYPCKDEIFKATYEKAE